MKLTEVERIQLGTELLLRHTMLTLHADGAALLRPRPEAPMLLVARTELWPHDGCEHVEAVWRLSRRTLLVGEPVRRGPYYVQPLFARSSPQLEGLLVCHGLSAEAPDPRQHADLFDLLVRQVMLCVSPRPRWKDLKAQAVDALPAGGRNQLQAALRAKIEEALVFCNGNVTRTARRLGIPLRTLWGHIQRMGIDTASFRVRPA